MKSIGVDELRELQMRILDYVDAFCRDNGIKYTLSGGTLLGAVRHGGYIPWDDDIDIQMLRSDYLKFTRLWNERKNDSTYELINIESNNNMGYPFGKIHNTETVTYVGNLERTGVFIDVFPLDKVIDYTDFIKRRNIIKGLYLKRRYVLAILKHLHSLKLVRASYYGIAKKINKVAQKMETQVGAYVFELTSGLLCKTPIPISVFDSYEDIKFENRTYMAVKDYDTYLTCTFGDYMQLPPIENRVSHHDFISYWK